jgi:hypothetical protein
MLQESDAVDLKPVFTIDGITYAFIAYRNVYLLAVTRRNCNVTTSLYFLHCLRKVLCSYLGELEEESIRDNFVIIYELLDETMDFGYPQITDSDVSARAAASEGVVSCVACSLARSLACPLGCLPDISMPLADPHEVHSDRRAQAVQEGRRQRQRLRRAP